MYNKSIERSLSTGKNIMTNTTLKPSVAAGTRDKFEVLGIAWTQDFVNFLCKFAEEDRAPGGRCHRCGGAGWGGGNWLHCEGGRCFACSGRGMVPYSFSKDRVKRAAAEWTTGAKVAKKVKVADPAKEEAKREANRIKMEAEQAKNAAEAAAKEDALEASWLEQNPNLADAYRYCLETEGVWQGAKDIAGKVRILGALSEKQAAVLEREFSSRKVSGESSPAPVGKQVITGEIVSFKWVESFTGFGCGTCKMLVIDDRGFKVFGTCPTSLSDAVKGSRVAFTATLEVSDNDPSFAYFSRPTKGSVLDAISIDIEEAEEISRLTEEFL